MSDYLDTSVLVSALADEPASARVRRWLAEAAGDEPHVSHWTLTEFSAALSIKVRLGTFSPSQRADAAAAWRAMLADSLTVDPVTPAHFEAAARFCDRHELGLRAGDALHLAIAASAGHQVVTLDATMAAACPELGIPVLAL